MTDYYILYNTYLKKCNNAIDNLKSIHIDTNALEERLKNINTNLEQLINDNTIGIDVYYTNATKELMSLLVDIEEYNIYFKIDNFIKAINIKVKNIDNITIKELNNDIESIDKYLKLVKTAYTKSYGNYYQIIEELYKLSFKLIEIEYIKKEKSDLFKILSSDDVDIQYLDNIIREKINNISLDEKLSLIIYELNSKGIDNNYVDERLIKKLSIIDYSKDKKEDIAKEFIEHLSDIKKDIYDKVKTNNTNKNDINKKCNRIIRNIRIEIAKRVIPITLVMTTILAGETYASYRLCRHKEYKTKEIIYTDGLNEPIKKETYEKELSNKHKKTLTITTPYQIDESLARKNFYERITKEYDLTDITLDNPEDYFSIDLSKRIGSETYEGNYLHNIEPGDFYENDIKTLTIIDQNEEDYKYLLSTPWFIVLLLNMFNMDRIILGIYLRHSLNAQNIRELKEQLKNNKYFKRLINDKDFFVDEIPRIRKYEKNYFNLTFYKYIVSHYGKIPEIEELYNQINAHYYINNSNTKDTIDEKAKIKNLKIICKD